MSNCLNGNLVASLDIGAGKDGKSLEFMWRGTELGVRVEGQEEYQFVDLEIDSSNISVELQISNGYIQWKRTYETEWKNLIAISELKGDKGDNGKSAYDLWLENGNEGTIDDFLSSLKGKDGEKGEQGLQGEKGEKGDTGEQGLPGTNGADGKDGLTPNITIGKVETLEPNQQATVTKRGDNENPIFDFGIPRGQDGTGGENSSIIVDFEVSGLKEIQPTSLDLNTGIFTCDEVSFEGVTQIVPKESNLNKFPKELILHNDNLKIVKLSETTFKIQKGSNDITYSTPQDNVDVSNFKFSEGTSIVINELDIDDGVYVVHLHGIRGRGGQTSFYLKDKDNQNILSSSIVDGKPILFITLEITITKNKDMYSFGVFGRSMSNKTSGTTLGFDFSSFNTSRDFKKADMIANKINIGSTFTNNTRLWIEKVI